MPRPRNTFKLGVTVIIMTVLLFGSILFISGQELFTASKGPLRVLFAASAGMPELAEGAFVLYLGQKVGKVTHVDFDAGVDPDNADIKDQHFLQVDAQLRNDLDLREDCEIQLTKPPLGGSGALEIVHRGYSETRRELSEEGLEDPVYGKITGFKTIVENLSNELDGKNKDGVIAKIKSQLDPQIPDSMVYKINQSLVDVNEFSAALKNEMRREDGTVLTKVHGGLDQIDGSLVKVDLGVDKAIEVLDVTKEGVDNAAGILEENREPIREAIASGRDGMDKFNTGVMEPLAAEFKFDGQRDASLLTKLHQSMSSVRDMSIDLRTSVAMNKNDISEIIGNVRVASSSFKQGVQNILLNPWWLLEKPSDAEKRERVLFNVAREYAEAAAQLDSATGRLQALLGGTAEQIPSDDEQLIKIRENLDATLENFTRAEQALLAEFNIQQ